MIHKNDKYTYSGRVAYAFYLKQDNDIKGKKDQIGRKQVPIARMELLAKNKKFRQILKDYHVLYRSDLKDSLK